MGLYNSHMETLSSKTSQEKPEEQLRQEQAEKLIGFLQRINATAYIQDIVSKNESAPDFKEFKDFLVRINGIARDIPVRQRTPDGKNVEIKGFVDTVNLPRQEDK